MNNKQGQIYQSGTKPLNHLHNVSITSVSRDSILNNLFFKYHLQPVLIHVYEKIKRIS